MKLKKIRENLKLIENMYIVQKVFFNVELT